VVVIIVGCGVIIGVMTGGTTGVNSGTVTGIVGIVGCGVGLGVIGMNVVGTDVGIVGLTTVVWDFVMCDVITTGVGPGRIVTERWMTVVWWITVVMV
jgi:hypothetical protein